MTLPTITIYEHVDDPKLIASDWTHPDLPHRLWWGNFEKDGDIFVDAFYLRDNNIRVLRLVMGFLIDNNIDPIRDFNTNKLCDCFYFRDKQGLILIKMMLPQWL